MVAMDDFVGNTRVLAVVKTGWSIRKDGSTPEINSSAVHLAATTARFLSDSARRKAIKSLVSSAESFLPNCSQAIF